MRRLLLVGVFVLGACVSAPPVETTVGVTTSTPGSASPPTTPTNSSVPPSTTTTAARPTSAVPAMELEDSHLRGAPDVLSDVLVEVTAGCVTATGEEGVHLVVWFRGFARTASIFGDEVRILQGWGEDSERTLKSGQRYSLRGLAGFSEELLEPVPSDCAYDARFLIWGVVASGPDVMTGEFPTRAVDAIASYSSRPNAIGPVTIDGGCVTIPLDDGVGLLVWPHGSVALLPDGNLRFSFWDNLIDSIVQSGDFVGGWSPMPPDSLLVNNPPADCNYDQMVAVFQVGEES